MVASMPARFATTAPQPSEGIPAVQADQELRLAAIKLYKEVGWRNPQSSI